MRPRGAAQRVVEPRMRELCSAMCRTVAAAHEGSVSDVYWDVLTFVETKLFSKLVREYLPDDAYQRFAAGTHREPRNQVTSSAARAESRKPWRNLDADCLREERR